MKRLPALMLVLAVVAFLAVQGEQPVVAEPAGLRPVALVHRLAPRVFSAPASSDADPFFGSRRPLPEASPEPSPEPSRRAGPAAIPAFRVIGKQQDEAGWAVFLTLAGSSQPVWVVRAGEVFNDHFQVVMLAPPQLVIRRVGTTVTRPFDIGKNEE